MITTWLKLGNLAADEAAKASLQKETQEIIDLSQQIHFYNKKMKDDLVCVYQYMVAYNQISQKEKGSTKSQKDTDTKLDADSNRPRNMMSYKFVLENWSVPNALPVPTQDMTMEIAQCCSWGAKIAYHVFSWIRTIRWPDNMVLRQHDHGITYLELLVNFHLVTGVNIPVTISRKGNVVHWEEFSSPKSLILPKKTRSATTQSVVLAACVQQLEQAFEQKFFPLPKKIGIRTLSQLGHYDLQKRTGFVRRPQLLLQKETVAVTDAYLTDCRNQKNFNLPLLVSRYIHELPRPLLMDMPSKFVDIQPGAVPYHRKKLKKYRANLELG